MMTHSMSNIYESSFLTALLLATGRIIFDPTNLIQKNSPVLPDRSSAL